MSAHPVVHAVPSPSLIQNERNEAAAFDGLAEQVDAAMLRTSDWTFARYRSAVCGRPLHAGYPDRAFDYIGRHVRRGGDAAHPLRGLRVLDLGAGDGVWSVILAEQGAEVISIEISPRQVELARRRMRQHDLRWDARVGSVFALREQFAPGTFDLVFAQAILHHLTFDLERVYAGMHHVLREGGRAIMTEPYCGSPRLRRIRERLAWLVPFDRESPDERPLDDADLIPLRHLFPAVTVDRYDVLARFARRIFRSAAMEKEVFRVDHAILRLGIFRHLAGCVFITARK